MLASGRSCSAGDLVAKYPLTHSQEGIWVDYLADKTSTQYNLTLEWNLDDVESQASKTDEIVAGTPSLN